MKILNISAPHPLKKAGIVVYDFHKNLELHGHESVILTQFAPDIKDKKIISYHSYLSKIIDSVKNRIYNQIKFRISGKIYNNEYYFDGSDETRVKFSTKSIIKRLGKFKPDLIIIHFAQGFLNPKNIYELNKRLNTRIYWYLMDMKPMTGGCCYTWDCKGYTNSCGNCPSLKSNDPHDITFKNLAFAKRYFEKTDLTILIGSEQLDEEVSESLLFKNKPKFKLILGINDLIFKPLTQEKKNALRINLGLNLVKRTIFIGAVNLNEKRKGGQILIEAFRLLFENYLENFNFSSCQIVIAGNGSYELKEILHGVTNNLIAIVAIGFLDTPEKLAEIFASSDVFLSPSIIDSGPMMVNQSILSGTPVIAFDIGVAKDLVKDHISGFKVKNINSQEYSNAIFNLLSLSDDKFKQLKNTTAQLGIKTTSFSANYNSFAKILGM